MKTKLIFAAKLALALAVLAGALAGVWKLYGKYTAVDDAAQEKPVKVERGNVEVVFQDIGDILSRDFRDIKSGTDGKIISLYVQEGQQVQDGEKLVTVRGGRSEAEAYTPVTITAPMSGLAVKCIDNVKDTKGIKFAKEGDVVSSSYGASATCIMRIANMSRLGVDLEIGENDIVKVKKDARVEVTLDAFPGVVLPGSITMISPQAESGKDYSGSSKIFRVAVTLDKIHPGMRLGMTARVKAVMDSRHGVLKASLLAIFFDGAEAYVYKKAASGPIKTAVKLGLRNETDAEILSGVKEGDELLVEKPE